MMRSPNGLTPHQGLNRLWIATTICAITVLSGSFVRPAFGAPAKLDGIGPPPESPFPLEAQPTQFSDAIAAALNNDNSARDVKGFSKNQPSAVDSYGNPIETLKPIETPDGRKVISAQGLQFEIPNYASGITEIKKPADDLLPPFIDHTAITEVKNSQAVTASKFSNSNPFLPAHNSATRPFSSQTANKVTTVTTTTTTTTTPATPIEENPFDSVTLPSWLAEFDYPDLAPGVPFIYNAEESNSDVSNDLLPPSQLSAETTDTTKPIFITSSPTSFNSFQIAPSSTNRHDSTFASASTSTTRTFAFNNSPSKVITTAKPFNIQNPFAKVPNSNNNNQEAITVPPVVFSPPTADAESKVDIVAVNDVSKADPRFDRENAATTADQFHINKHSSSSFNKNFAAPFEPTSMAGSADSSASTDQDFGSSTKTTFSKSNEGKVITNNVFGTSSGVTSTSKQSGFNAGTTSGQAAFQKDIQQSSSSFIGTSNTFNKASTPSAFSTFNGAQQSTNFNSFNNKGNNRPVTNVNTGKYTGGFGGSPGVLGSGKLGSAVRSDGSIRPANVAFTQGTAITPTAPTKFPTNPNFANRVGISTSTGFAVDSGVGANKYQGTFGGPPGVLNPFDNVKANK